MADEEKTRAAKAFAESLLDVPVVLKDELGTQWSEWTARLLKIESLPDPSERGPAMMFVFSNMLFEAAPLGTEAVAQLAKALRAESLLRFEPFIAAYVAKQAAVKNGK